MKVPETESFYDLWFQFIDHLVILRSFRIESLNTEWT